MTKTVKMTKAAKVARANEWRSKLAAQMGCVASGNWYALGTFYEMTDIVMMTLGLPNGFKNLIENYYSHDYCPTLRGDLDPLYTVLADAYDFEMARRGGAARAYRGN